MRKSLEEHFLQQPLVNKAYNKAKDFVASIYGTRKEEVRLEEIIRRGNIVKLTLSFPYQPTKKSVGIFDPLSLKRDYKVLEIDLSDGSVKSMKIKHFDD